MAASVALASLLALLAANTTSQLDCLCGRILNETEGNIWKDTVSDGERKLWLEYCEYCGYHVVERCETLEQPSSVMDALARLVPWNWREGAPPAAVGLSCGGGECDCGATLAALRALEDEEGFYLACHLADALPEYYSAEGLNVTKWTEKTLAADHLRQPKLSQLLNGARVFTGIKMAMASCEAGPIVTSGDSQAELAAVLKQYSKEWHRAARLFPLFATLLSQLFIPLAFEHMGNTTNGQQLHGWIRNMERVRDLLEPKLWGFVQDVQLLSDLTPKYKLEEDKDTPGKYKIRRPLLNEALLKYQERLLSFRGDFGALCEQQLPQASHVFGLADALYSFYRRHLTLDWRLEDAKITVDDVWQLEDQSKTTVWVDTGCLQLLADAVDRPRCPLEELPLEASRRRRQCRERLWRDLVERPPRPPVTSYLAYNERAAVSLCLLAWMAANSYGVCQDVPFSITRSVNDATCYLESPPNQTCLLPNTTDAICSVSRAILLFKCRDFTTVNNPKICSVNIHTTANYSETEELWGIKYYRVYGKATERTLSYKESLNSMTLKYRDFQVDTLQPLEYSFIVVNVFFRLLTASVYMWLPRLRNLPGKILLSFQLTGLVQVVCSEVVHRMLDFPDLPTAVLVDSSLTLLGCLWLNTFCFQMFACVRELRLPSHLKPAEASMMFRRQLPWALIPWAIVTTTCAALEKSNKYYLMHSRITLIAAISLSIAFNLLILGLVAFIYLRKKRSTRRLNVVGDDKGFSKKQLIFMSVNTIFLSGICVIIRIGFHQADGIAQYVYYAHIATMLQGPLLFVFFVCNGTTLPALRNRLLALWRPDVYRPGLELGSVVERQMIRRRPRPPPTVETSL